MKISSKAFGNGREIPTQYTCEGEDRSPPLQISDVPAGAKTLALICDDPDAPAGTWVHWSAWHINPQLKEIPEDAKLNSQGKNDFRNIGYGGPCPPKGHGPHRYFFKLYALDLILPLKPGSSKADLEKAMEGHILAKAELMGTFTRG